MNTSGTLAGIRSLFELFNIYAPLKEILVDRYGRVTIWQKVKWKKPQLTCSFLCTHRYTLRAKMK